jgi:GH43 family beta-xylosidase
VVKNPDGPGYWYIYSGMEGIFSEYALSPADFKYDYKNRIFAPEKGSDFELDIWAPELHRIGGKWYIYFCARPRSDFRHRMFVISGDDPMKPFGDVKNMSADAPIRAIDQTVFEYKGKLYTVYSHGGSDGSEASHQDLYIAEMASPWEIKDKRVCLSSPTLPWERRGWNVNEGPVVLRHKGKLFIVFSAAGAAFDYYCLGVLTFRGGDIMNPANWEKHPEPILTGRGDMLATGHCTFTKDADGNDWCVFHCNPPHDPEKPEQWVPRYMCLQPVVWINDFPTFSPVVEKPKYFKYER